MAGRIRTTKKLAQRINLNYFKRLGGIPRWRRILSGISVFLGLAWLGWYAAIGSHKPYNAGPLAHAHALLSQKCEVCHVRQASFRQTATDQACLACHDGPIHHANQTFTPSCSNCHVEHQGALLLASTSDRACTQCHANIRGFDRTHPEFAALRPGASDAGTIKFNHAVHLRDELRGPGGPVQLECANCHRPPLMEPINYEKHCASCHPLQFDPRVSEPAPHKDPQAVTDFVRNKLSGYLPPARIADVQSLLWRKACQRCHTLTYPNGPDALPVVAKAAITTRWLPHAKFDHKAHQMVQCASCHAKANDSRETSDVLIPGIQTCQQCHRPAKDGAEARCFECHNYHDWSKEKPAAGKFTVKQLADGS